MDEKQTRPLQSGRDKGCLPRWGLPGTALGLALALAAGGAQAQPLELLYAFGTYREAKVVVDHAGNIVVAARDSGTNGTLDVCDVSDPTTVHCEPFGSTVSAGPPETFERPADVDFDGAGNMVIADAGNNRIQICDASDLPNGPVGVRSHRRL